MFFCAPVGYNFGLMFAHFIPHYAVDHTVVAQCQVVYPTFPEEIWLVCEYDVQ